jgi:hypothetical protein
MINQEQESRLGRYPVPPHALAVDFCWSGDAATNVATYRSCRVVAPPSTLTSDLFHPTLVFRDGLGNLVTRVDFPVSFLFVACVVKSSKNAPQVALQRRLYVDHGKNHGSTSRTLAVLCTCYR